jgi:ubiquinone/menaquinone biosynthesis C-methylase UbiE
MSGLHREFQRGQAGDSEAAFAWLDGAHASPVIQAVEQRMLEERPVGVGDRVLDVGCGLGHELQRLAPLVGPHGRLLGVDVSPAMVVEARRRAAALELPIAFEFGDAHALELPDESFDLCRAVRVLRYLQSPERVVGEMARVVCRGGFALAFDFDSDQTVVDAPDATLTRRIAEILDAAVPHPWIGRQLFGLFRRAGLADVRVVPHPICLTGTGGFGMYRRLNEATIAAAVNAGQLSAADAAGWWLALEESAGAETFLVAILGFIVVGRKP